MARCRMIRPAFFDDEKLATISLAARLTFIGLWVFSDDYGVVRGHTKWLRSMIFPYGDVDEPEFDGCINELIRIDVIRPFTKKGEQYFWIKNFSKHQTIQRPSATRNPTPPPELINDCDEFAHDDDGSMSTHGGLHEDSMNTHGILNEGSMRAHGGLRAKIEREREIKKKVLKKESSRNPRPEDGDVGVTADPSLSGGAYDDQPISGGNGRGPHGLTPNALARLWNETADPVFPRVRLPLSDARARKLRPAIRERPDPDWWRSLIERANGVSFLRGDNDRGWRADLEFVVRRRDEILEGKYDRAKEDEPEWIKLISQDG